MVSGIELSKSSRSKCNICKKQIGKGVPRGYVYNPEHYGSQINLCYKCSLDTIGLKILKLRKIRIELKKMIKKNQKLIVLDNL